MQLVRLKFVKKFIKLIKITNCVCVAVYVMLLWCALSVYTLETCRSSLFVISTIIVTDIYVHSLVELKIKKNNTEFKNTLHFPYTIQAIKIQSYCSMKMH